MAEQGDNLGSPSDPYAAGTASPPQLGGDAPTVSEPSRPDEKRMSSR